MQFLRLISLLMLGVILLATSSCLTTAAVLDDEGRPLCPCPRNFDPVCAANLVTYSNRCEYDCVRRDVERRGRSLNLLRSGAC
ncbi:PREDICTED: serine protease inhibitor Kazal-type 2 [Rhagoletis zephyria]|uniref:serine protease inhibitor Kazal-type 2 n=1 Tax=Rhagoletis zephyria TaxID=28612 RepID=UPI0008114BD6|nr:PREDICTED: serine protease inhibitor Kazal-type 2 [Rhagoletis zephyria]